MKEYTIADQPRLLNQLIESLGQAAGAASQLLHQHQDPRWFVIRDALEGAKAGVTGVATIAATKISTEKPV